MPSQRQSAIKLNLYITMMKSPLCNEEYKINGMEGNLRTGDDSSIIDGPFFIVGLMEDDFRSLTEDEI